MPKRHVDLSRGAPRNIECAQSDRDTFEQHHEDSTSENVELVGCYHLRTAHNPNAIAGSVGAESGGGSFTTFEWSGGSDDQTTGKIEERCEMR